MQREWCRKGANTKDAGIRCSQDAKVRVGVYIWLSGACAVYIERCGVCVCVSRTGGAEKGLNTWLGQMAQGLPDRPRNAYFARRRREPPNV